MKPRATDLTLEAFRCALDETRRLSHASVRAEHILLGLLQLADGTASAALDACGVERAVVTRRLRESLPSAETTPHEGEYPYHPSGVTVLRKLTFPESEAGTITSGRVLLVILGLEDDEVVTGAFASAGVDVSALVARLADDPQESE